MRGLPKIEVTLLGMLSDVILSHQTKTLLSKDVSPSGKVTFFSAGHSWKTE